MTQPLPELETKSRTLNSIFTSAYKARRRPINLTLSPPIR